MFRAINEVSDTSQLLQTLEICEKPKKAEMDIMNSRHMTCPTLAVPCCRNNPQSMSPSGSLFHAEGDSCAAKAVR
ncbi:hypothetical protein T03_6127 [Trichinella britovi]|uniref:Uncharacterized protein n=1 Tax=Trichinella britovi TaxID=45882 RepID=A0A0V1C8L9_TRIBR|nr:hypothetical protein T03_6127 [Trichinella britovi]